MWLKAKLKPLESGWGFWVNHAKGTIFVARCGGRPQAVFRRLADAVWDAFYARSRVSASLTIRRRDSGGGAGPGCDPIPALDPGSPQVTA